MSSPVTAARMALDHLERLLTAARSSAEARELDSLSDRLLQVRSRLLSDTDLTVADLDAIFAEMDLVSRRYEDLSLVGSSPFLPRAVSDFRRFAEAAEIHFSHLAGSHAENFRGGLLRQYREAADGSNLAKVIALDIVTSASTEIAIAKVHLIRAAISLDDSHERRARLLQAVYAATLEAIRNPVWQASGRAPAIDDRTLLRYSAFTSTVSERRVQLPSSVAGTNTMLPNQPLPGWEEQNHLAVRELLDSLAAAGVLFLDQIPADGRPRRVALKIELNMGIEGAPSVTDPVVTGAVLYELLERGFSRGVPLHFTVGDSCGIENAPVGRTSMDIMRETGNFHYAIKAALRFVLRRDEDAGRREKASQMLNGLAGLEDATPPAFLGSTADRLHWPDQISLAEALAEPWVRCVDYDDTGFIAVRPEVGPLGTAIWGSPDFYIAKPWVEADHRVHVTRGASNHLFAGWTGSLKGLIGLHALGQRPADQGMNERGETPLDMLAAMMHLSGFNSVIGRRGGLQNLEDLAHSDPVATARYDHSVEVWRHLSEAKSLIAGWTHWIEQTTTLERELRSELKGGASERAVMAKMRRQTRRMLHEANERSPGFRDALWLAVAEGTRSGLLTAWQFREIIPAPMRDERMGMRIGLLSQLPMQAELVVQGLPKIGLGGGPDAYVNVNDVGVVVAGTDEAAVDLVALRAAGVSGNLWASNYPIHGALQFGRGPALWDELRVV